MERTATDLDAIDDGLGTVRQILAVGTIIIFLGCTPHNSPPGTKTGGCANRAQSEQTSRERKQELTREAETLRQRIPNEKDPKKLREALREFTELRRELNRLCWDETVQEAKRVAERIGRERTNELVSRPSACVQ
jgi:hypothetical protein